MRCLECLACRLEVVHEESGETEIHQTSALGELVADRLRDLRPLFEECNRFREDVPISRHDAQGAEAPCELSLQLPLAQDGQAAGGELLSFRVVSESGADGDPANR